MSSAISEVNAPSPARARELRTLLASTGAACALLLATSCGDGGGSSATSIDMTVKARPASTTSPPAYRFALIGPRADEITLDVEPGSPVSRVGFTLPDTLSAKDVPVQGAWFYTVAAYDADVFTGLGTIAVHPSGTRYLFVDTTDDATTGLGIVRRAAALHGTSDGDALARLAAAWGVTGDDPQRVSGHVLQRAGVYNREDPSPTLDDAARKLIEVMESGAGATRLPDLARPSSTALEQSATVAGAFAEAIVGELVSPFLGAAVGALFSVIANAAGATDVAKAVAFAQLTTDQVNELNDQLEKTDAAVEAYAQQNDFIDTQNALAKVTGGVALVYSTFEKEFMPCFAGVDMSSSEAVQQSLAGETTRRCVERILTEDYVTELNTTLEGYAPLLSGKDPASNPLALLTTQLNYDVEDLTAYGTFDSVFTVLEDYNGTYLYSAQYVATAFDALLYMYTVADFIVQTYPGDGYDPHLPSASTWSWCAQNGFTGSDPQTTAECVASSFAASNAQATSLLTSADLTGSGPNSRWVTLPGSPAGYVPACTIDTWAQAPTQETLNDLTENVAQAGTLGVTCPANDGSPVSSTFTYTLCAGGTIASYDGYLGCNNTSMANFGPSSFTIGGAIDSTTKKTITISSSFEVSIAYQSNSSSTGNAWLQQSDATTLFDTGSTSSYLALLEDVTMGNVFNYVYDVESPSLGCPKSGVGGYVAGSCNAVDFQTDDPGLCPLNPTYPYLCSCIETNGRYYCLEQWKSCGDGCDEYEEIASLTSCPVTDPTECQID